MNIWGVDVTLPIEAAQQTAAAESQNALRRIQVQQAMQQMQSQNALRQALGGIDVTGNPNALAQALIRSGHVSEGVQILDQARKREQEQQFQQLLPKILGGMSQQQPAPQAQPSIPSPDEASKMLPQLSNVLTPQERAGIAIDMAENPQEQSQFLDRKRPGKQPVALNLPQSQTPPQQSGGFNPVAAQLIASGDPRGRLIGEMIQKQDEAKAAREQNAELRREQMAQSQADNLARIAAAREGRPQPAPQILDRPEGAFTLDREGNIKPLINPTTGQPFAPKPTAGKQGGQLPTQALKLQQEELDAIGTAASITADIGALKSQIDSGEIKLGPMSNAANAARNWAGISTPESANYASYRATLEKLRNDSLRLNKGVQTEGDALRAWNELMASSNDTRVVKQRLGEIQKINERAANLRKMNIDAIRNNYGLEPLDATAYQQQPAAVGSGKQAGLKVGDVQKGYRYKGGDPSKRESWEAAQ